MANILRTPLKESVAESESEALSVRSEGGVALRWQGLRVRYASKRKELKILDDVTGGVAGGDCCAILGPSGSGKSTLLNLLAGRLKPTSRLTVDGTVTVNNRVIDPIQYRTRIAYVLQEDCLPAMSTPREELLFSAALRLSKTVSAQQRIQKVNQLLAALKLEKCADTLIGNILKPGISGGEKKRTAIAVELITDPRVLFLDEPTSGLDSYAAFSVVSMLREISNSGCTVLCTIHQPSSEIFHLFASMVLLSNGRMLYSGATTELVAYLTAKGFVCPPNYNPADFVLFLVQTESHETLRNLEQPPNDQASSNFGTGDLEMSTIPPNQRRGFWTQLTLLSIREYQSVIRDKPSLFARFGMLVILNLLFSLIFYRVGNSTDLMSHFGAITQIMIGSLMSSSQPLILQFPLERPIFLREYAVGTYGSIPYFLSKVTVEVLMALISAALVWLVAFYLMELQGDIVLLILITWGLSLVASSTALLLGCIAKDVKTAMQTAPAILVPQLLFAGFFIKISQIPSWLRWAQYLCSLKFAMNLAMITEFTTCHHSQQEECDMLLHENQVHAHLWYVYVGVLAALFVVFRIAALVALTAQAK